MSDESGEVGTNPVVRWAREGRTVHLSIGPKDMTTPITFTLPSQEENRMTTDRGPKPQRHSAVIVEGFLTTQTTRAECLCGWVGEQVDSRHQAYEDYAAHVRDAMAQRDTVQ